MQMVKIGKALAAVSLSAAIFASGSVFGADKDDTHMQKALEHLSAAKKELEEAGANKGGHRAQALRLIDQAKDEVKAGMTYTPEDAKAQDKKAADSKAADSKKK